MRFIAGIGLVQFPVGAGAVTVVAGNDPSGKKEATMARPAIVNGNPAVAWGSETLNAVRYARATDAGGTAWGTPVTVDSGWSIASRVSLLMVDGKPALCYSGTSGQLRYARAQDPEGTVWGAPVVLNTGAAVTYDHSMEIADGNPAICFTAVSSTEIRYIRATDPGGLAWSPPALVDLATTHYDPVMKIVQGHPALAYTLSGGFLWFQRAKDPAGTAWNTRIRVSSVLGQHIAPSLQVVNGVPAIAFFENSGDIDIAVSELKYVRAADATGSVWNPAFTLEEFGTFNGPAWGGPCSLAVLNGKPAIAYHTNRYFRGLKYVQALDSDGATREAWKTPVTVDIFASTEAYPGLLEVNGSPTLTYSNYQQNSLHFLRGVESAGTVGWPARLAVGPPPGSDPTPDGGSKNYGLVRVGTKKAVPFILTSVNSGSVTVTGLRLTIDGPGAAEFSVTIPPPATLAGGASADFTVEYAPVTAGLKTAVLHLMSDTEGSLNPWNLTVTGDSRPEFLISAPSGNLNDDSSVSFPLTDPGSTVDMVFTIWSEGGGDLQISGVTFDGPDAADFSIPVPPAPVVPPGEHTTFTLRFAPAAAGNKKAALHLASNIAGTRNPFDVALLALPGSPEASFPSADLALNCVAVQADGKILTGDESVTRLNPNGSPDNTFFAPLVSGGSVHSIAVQQDGMILIGGTFTLAGGHPHRGLARLSADGTVDHDFAPDLAPGVSCLALQPDGKILAGGPFSSVVRLHADGSVDTGFSALHNGIVHCLALQPDGKVLAGGNFNRIGNTPVAGMARLRSNGNVDAFFSPPSCYDVLALALQPDGSILRGGLVFPGNLPGMQRLEPDGTLDPTLNLRFSGAIRDLVLQADGKCLVAGEFSNAGSETRYRLARINTDGSIDSTFYPVINGFRTRLALQADGRILVAGAFTEAGGSPHLNFARLQNDPATTLLQLESPSTVRWWRDGSTPEVSDVWFEVNALPSSNWIPLGKGARITGGWELSGLTLPAGGRLRARARAAGSGSGSVTESLLTLPPALERWRQQYFHTPDNTGDAADDADPDKDGLTNFTEFAFGLNPVDRTSNALPEFTYANGSFTAAFTAPEGREDVVYGAEWSATMQPGTWAAIPDTGAAPVRAFSVTAGGRVFARYRIGTR